MKKIVIYGAESTGKSTLSIFLARYFEVFYLPEFARTYYTFQKKIRNLEQISVYEDISQIVIGQLASEEILDKQAKHFYFLDTDILQTIVYSYHYFGKCPDWILEIFETRSYDFYLLMDTDIAWQADPLRDRANQRQEMGELFEFFLKKYKKKYKKISGQGDDRLQNAVFAVQEFFKDSPISSVEPQ